MIIAVGFKVNNERAVQFRKWANAIVKDYTIKGWVMDEERLKNGGTALTEKYFEEQLEKIREIRLSETKEFFAKVQNKMHFAVHGQTAVEVIYHRADADRPHMGLTSWKEAPLGKIMRSDVFIAKNYLTENELYSLERIDPHTSTWRRIGRGVISP